MVSRWERGVRTPRPHYVRLLCGLYDLPADELGLVSDLEQDGAGDDEAPDDPYYQLLVRELLGMAPALSSGRSDGSRGPVNRRRFLAYGAGVVGSTALDPEGLAAILNGLHPVDSPRLGELRVLTTRLEQDYDMTAPRVLMPMVRGNLARLRAAKPPTSEALTRQLHSLIGELAVLAGRLSFRMHNIGEAEWYYSLAAELAAESLDDVLLAFAMAARSSLYSNIGSRSKTNIALALLDHSATLVGSSSPHLRGWLLAHRAEEHAALHDQTACYRDQDGAARALAAVSARGEGFFVNWSSRRLDGFCGCCAVELGEWQAAVDILERTAARTSPAMMSQRSAILIDLATAYAGQHQLDHASDLLATTLDIASQAGLAEIVRRIIAVRQHDLGSADTPSVRRLDDQLHSIVLAR